MFGSINKQFNAMKRLNKGRQFILEAVLGVEEVLPGSEEEMEDVIDVDSVPDDAYRKLDAALDKIVNDPNYDDTEIEEQLDGDDDDYDPDEISDSELDVIIDECCSDWLNS